MNPRWGESIEGGFFDSITHSYRDSEGKMIPSVTQIFDLLGITDFSLVPEATLEWKRNFGNALHRGLELLVFDHLDWDTCADPIIAPLTGLEEWLKSVDYKPEFAEEKRIITVNGMKVGGTLDHRGSFMYKGKRRAAVIDVKSGSKYSKSWLWQVAVYCSGAPKHELGTYLGIVLQVDPDGKVNPFFSDTLVDLREFTTLLAATNILLNNGMVKLKNKEED